MMSPPIQEIPNRLVDSDCNVPVSQCEAFFKLSDD